MQLKYVRLAGTLATLGAAQFVIMLTVAEALYPDYSISLNYISDLGVGPSALIFNTSVFLLGLTTMLAACMIYLAFKPIAFSVLLALTGIGTMGVGIFTEHAGTIHLIVSVIAFLFGGLSAIFSYKLIRKPLSYLAVLLGFVAIISLALMSTGNYLGLGAGGMERMIGYPIFLWGVILGTSIGSSEPDARERETV